MCGIAGVVGRGSREVAQADLERMLSALRHRGPDDEGTYFGPGAAIGMRRLAIVDPRGGAQPFFSEDRRIVAVVNGEIYNHAELRRDLERRGHRFAGGSDAEVVVHLYEEHGPAFAEELSGMFAVAVWDSARRKLVLVRDPLGIKPLLWRRAHHGVAFASELRALLALGDVPPLNLEALDRYLLYRTSVGEETICEGIRRVPPGKALVLYADGRTELLHLGQPSPAFPQLTLDEATEELDRRLARSVERHLQGDQPIGVLLSGGVDSGLVLHYAASLLGGSLRAYTAGFPDFGDEGEEFAVTEATARAYGVPLTRLEIDAGAAQEHLLMLTREIDEPNGDPTALPLRAIAQRAAQDVPVVLSGEGADELFAGYPGYDEPLVVGRFSRWLPMALRRTLAASRLPGRGLAARSLTPLGERYLGIGMCWQDGEREALYRPDVRRMLAGSHPGGLAAEAFASAAARGGDWLRSMLQVDREVWLADEALMKLDRLTMAFGLEARVPYLDRSVVELADALPWNYKVRAGQGKFVLRQVARRHLPARAALRRKRGFPSPISRLLAGPMRDFAYDVLTGDTARNRGLFDGTAVQGALGRLRGRPGQDGRHVYVLLALELWLRQVYDVARSGAAAKADYGS